MSDTTAGIRILVVEDEALIAEEIRDRLTRLSYQIVGVADKGAEAIALAKAKRPNLILMDIRLKGHMDGIEAAEHIYRCLNIPVIYLTAHADQATLQRAKASAPFGYLVKPFQERDLLAAIEMAVRRHEHEQRRLMESDLNYTAALACIADGVIAVGADEQVRFMNPVAEALTGWRLADARGVPIQRVFKLVDMASEAALGHPVAQALRQRVVVPLGAPDRLLDCVTVPIPIEGSAAPIVDAMGVVTGAVVTFRDITDRKRARAELQASEARYRTLVEQASDGIFICNAHGAYLDVNSAGYEMFGYTRDEFLCLSMADLVAPEEVLRVSLEVARLMQGSPARSEWRFQRKDGSFFHGELNARQLPDFRLLAILRDITDRKQAEEALITAREEWEQSFNALTDYICVLDHGGRILHANRAMRERFEPAHGALIGLDYRAVYHGALTPMPEEGCASVLAGGPAIQIETALPRLRGSFLISCYPLQSPAGERRGAVHVVRDVTQQRELEARLHQSQKIQAIGQLAGGIAHDFNNLLTIINSYSELLLLEAIEPAHPLREMALGIRDAGERAAQLTRQLLLFSRKAVLQPEVQDLNAVLQQAVKMLQRLIGEDITLTIIQAPGRHYVKVDPGQIQQLIINLALNARDAMPQGGRLTLETQAVSFDAGPSQAHLDYRPGRFVQLAVSDIGCGMTHDVKAHLFEPFFTTKGPGKGTGLGLATVYGIVQQTGGFIRVDSEVGSGTTFEIFLPAVEIEASALPPDALDHRPPSGTETVLVVEDEEGVRQLIRRVLERHGYTVLEATSGPAAIWMMAQQQAPIDLLITDIVMPEMSGRQLAGLLRAQAGALKILFMSGYTEEAIARHGIFTAADTFLQKPFTPHTLAKKVRESLDGRVLEMVQPDDT